MNYTENALMNTLLLTLLLSVSIPAFSTNITAKSWILADDANNIIQSKNRSEQRSIGSITKLMTVMVVLDAQQNLKESLGSLNRQNLIQFALVKSDNNAARVLCDSYPGGNVACVTAMNRRAQSLGMTHTNFVEPSGLSIMNVSTAEDLLRLVLVAKEYPEIVQASRTANLRIHLRKSYLTIRNTNPSIAHNPYNFWVSKTGFINAAGGCIVMMKDTALGRRIVVVLGSKSTQTRILEAETILALK
jgi:serine-type D-Ala-D-Ala endopeptidase (penicillin-binding protein 7)